MAGSGSGAMVEQQLIAATQIIEQQLDAEIERMDNLDSDDLEMIRRERLSAMKKRQEKKQDWIANVIDGLDFVITLTMVGKVNVLVYTYCLGGKESRCVNVSPLSLRVTVHT